MFRRLVVIVGLVLPILAAAGTGSELISVEWQVRIGAGSSADTTKRFRGGERACVIVVGDHQPRSPTEVRVYDARKRLVSESKSNTDTVAVIWYPAETAEYRIEILNRGGEYNDMTLYYQGVDRR
jgi:hypothetical protein